MKNSQLQVLSEDNHCLAVFKPAGMLTMGDRTGDESIVELAREYLRRKYDKPGKVFVGVVHRLDRPVSGVLVLARTSKAASRLSEQFRKHSIRKVYHAVVEGLPSQSKGKLIDWLVKDEATNVSRVVRKSKLKTRIAESQPNQLDAAKQCRLAYRVRKPRMSNSRAGRWVSTENRGIPSRRIRSSRSGQGAKMRSQSASGRAFTRP
jgi:23S rRNA-/tRNA-specific pseudouridylate synthase